MKTYLWLGSFVFLVTLSLMMAAADARQCQTSCYPTYGGGQTCNTWCY